MVEAVNTADLTTQDTQSKDGQSTDTKADQDDWLEQHKAKCKVFMDWCGANGVVGPKIEYPAYFEGGLVGARATAAIEHREAFLKIPFKMLMTVHDAQNHPVLGKIIEENPHLFDEEAGRCDWE